jgi:hypothetical protein
MPAMQKHRSSSPRSWTARLRRSTAAAPARGEVLASREPVAVSPDLGFIPAVYIPTRARAGAVSGPT